MHSILKLYVMLYVYFYMHGGGSAFIRFLVTSDHKNISLLHCTNLFRILKFLPRQTKKDHSLVNQYHLKISVLGLVSLLENPLITSPCMSPLIGARAKTLSYRVGCLI